MRSRRPAAFPAHRPLPLLPALLVALALTGLADGARAQTAPAIAYDLPAGPLDATLTRIARQAGRILVVDPALVGGRSSAPVKGSLTPDQAYARALAGSGLELVRGADGSDTLRRSATPPPRTAAPAATGTAVAAAQLPTVTVQSAAPGETATGHVAGNVARRSATATKTDTPILETPQSLSVVTADRIEAMGALTLRDALGYTPGVGVAPYGADSRYDWITVRGFDAYSPGFYLDGLPLRNNGNFGVWKTDNYGAERIELLRGPASVLYGQGNPGGVVNVVSKRPTEEPVRELQLQLGDHQRRQVAADFSGALNADGTLLYRLTGVARDAKLPDGRMPDDYQYIAPAFTWQPSADTRLTLLTQFSRTRAGTYTRTAPAYGSLLPTAAGTRIPADLYLSDPTLNRFHHEQQMVGYQFEHRIDGTWTVRQNLRSAHLDLDYRQVSPDAFITVDPDNPRDPANFRTLSRSLFSSRERTSAFALDNQIEGDLRLGDWRHQLIAGLDHQRTRVDQVSRSGGTAPSLDLAAPFYGGGPTEPAPPYLDGINRLTQTGLYVQDQMKWRDRWVFNLGGRYDWAETTNDDRGSATRTTVKDHKATGRAGVVYLMDGGWAPYAGYTQSFLPTNTVDPATGQPFAPETARQYEVGIRYQPPGRRQNFSAAVFDLRRNNYISYDAITFLPQQRGQLSVRGLELEATAELMPRLNLVGSYTFMPRAVVTQSVNPSEIGRQASAVPRHRLSLWVDYRFDNGVRVGLGARYNGSTRGEGERAPAPVPAYTLYDALLGYDLGRWNLALNVRNLSNRSAISNCTSFACYYVAPRSVVASATYRF
ncbi:TonB-dependent siderophore receptor [uncultured Pseudacidovorax sp.]|uniref:TonB-dependent siderophore receptor n=1 Tax=uncultured Pseudacidovorax sp. TaxID=679313 RepID=UPI0025F111E1|nr:TonB-dependent siderophore receptor [uncultured Pseudacidovorax sp.]